MPPKHSPKKITITGPLETCPTCGHAHPNGMGLLFCLCNDCALLFGTVPYEYLAPKFQERYKELRAAQGVHANG